MPAIIKQNSLVPAANDYLADMNIHAACTTTHISEFSPRF